MPWRLTLNHFEFSLSHPFLPYSFGRCVSYYTVKPRYIRVNTTLLKRADALEAFVADGWIEVKCDTYDEYLNAINNLTDEQFISDIHVNNLFVFPASSKRHWALNAMTKESKLILQDKASCLPSFLLNPARGSVVLDMCAAPGMKTSHLAAMMKNRGTVYAIENNRQRYERLKTFMDTTSAKIVQCINADVLSIGKILKSKKCQWILPSGSCNLIIVIVGFRSCFCVCVCR